MELNNNTILITGGSGGIGLELARQFLQLGNEVIITGRSFEKLEKIKVKLPKIHVFQSDLRIIEEIKILCEDIQKQFPNLNLLINNAGIGLRLNLKDPLSDKTITEEIATNFQGPICMINYLLPHLLKQPKAAIVNVSSAVAFSPFPVVPIYSATKAGLHSYTISLRQQLKLTKIKIFEIMPPTTKTDMLNGFSATDLKNIQAMPVEKLVKICLKEIKSDHFEIRPGQSNTIKSMSRFAPTFILNQMSKSLNNFK